MTGSRLIGTKTRSKATTTITAYADMAYSFLQWWLDFYVLYTYYSAFLFLYILKHFCAAEFLTGDRLDPYRVITTAVGT